MYSVLMRALSFAFIIVIGIIMKATGLASEEAGSFAKKISINLTLVLRMEM